MHHCHIFIRPLKTDHLSTSAKTVGDLSLMANGTVAPGLSFPPKTFARLTPGPFLHAHLKQSTAVRPNGRAPREFRLPVVNNNSLSHSNGSSLVRIGDTAIVCGIRAEVLRTSDIPRPPSNDMNEDDLVEHLGLLVPNVELSTGCSNAHLPGNPPGSRAQALTYRILALLNSTNLISPADLSITYTEPSVEDGDNDEGPKIITKAYWTLYIDILCIALDGNPFDAAWAAVMSALQNTRLPKAWWDADREMILASPLAADSKLLRMGSLPIASTFAVYDSYSPLKLKDEAESWILADPDGFEEDVCHETLTVVVDVKNKKQILVKLEKQGGSVVNGSNMQDCVQLAHERWEVFREVLQAFNDPR